MTITVHSILQMKSNNQIQPNYVVTFHYPSDPEMDDAAYLYVLESAAQKRLKTEYESLLTLYKNNNFSSFQTNFLNSLYTLSLISSPLLFKYKYGVK